MRSPAQPLGSNRQKATRRQNPPRRRLERGSSGEEESRMSNLVCDQGTTGSQLDPESSFVMSSAAAESQGTNAESGMRRTVPIFPIFSLTPMAESLLMTDEVVLGSGRTNQDKHTQVESAHRHLGRFSQGVLSHEGARAVAETPTPVRKQSWLKRAINPDLLRLGWRGRTALG